MAISSLVVDAMPDALERVAAELARREGVEVHGIDHTTGRIVVTVEAPDVYASKRIAEGFIGVGDVLNVNLVYVNVEDELEARHAAGRATRGAGGNEG